MMTFRNTLLLTGAGFTANFGGFLARDMWAKIFNNPRLDSAGNVKLELRKNFDFEEIYSKIIDDRRYIPEEQSIVFESVLNDAYLKMDEVIQKPSEYNTHPADVRHFLEYFSEKEGGAVGGVFTLNQDLYLERQMGWNPLGPQSMRYAGNFGNIQQDINPSRPKTLPNQNEVNEYKNSQFSDNFCFIKLHGSLGWVSSEGIDGKIIGINKIEVLNKVPILKWYFQLFEDALSKQNTKLIVIGYGFRDKHINALLAKSAEEHGLKLHIISPEQPESFYERLIGKPPTWSSHVWAPDEIGTKIWNAVEGYYPYKLSDIFPRSQDVTAARLEIRTLLGQQV